MTRPTDQEVTFTEEAVGYSQFPRGGSGPHRAGPHGETPGSVRGRGGGDLIVVSREGTGEAGEAGKRA